MLAHLFTLSPCFYQASRFLLMSTRFGGQWWVQTERHRQDTKLEGEKGKLSQPLLRPFEF